MSARRRPAEPTTPRVFPPVRGPVVRSEGSAASPRLEATASATRFPSISLRVSLSLSLWQSLCRSVARSGPRRTSNRCSNSSHGSAAKKVTPCSAKWTLTINVTTNQLGSLSLSLSLSLQLSDWRPLSLSLSLTRYFSSFFFLFQ